MRTRCAGIDSDASTCRSRDTAHGQLQHNTQGSAAGWLAQRLYCAASRSLLVWLLLVLCVCSRSSVEFMKTFNVPLLLLGGGGYTVRNVARCWTYETGLALDTVMSDELPYNQYYEYYGPDFNLHIQPSNMENLNTPNYLAKQEALLMQALKELPHAPSVQYSTQPPRDPAHEARDEAEKAKRESMVDVRNNTYDVDKGVADRREFYADDRDQDGTTVPKHIVPQLVSTAHMSSVLASSSTLMPAAIPAAAATSASASAAPASSSSSAVNLTSLLPSFNQASPAFQATTNTTSAGAPGISAPLVQPAPMDTA